MVKRSPFCETYTHTCVFFWTVNSTHPKEFLIFFCIFATWWTFCNRSGWKSMLLHTQFVIITLVAARWNTRDWMIITHFLSANLAVPPIRMNRILFGDFNMFMAIWVEYTFKFKQTFIFHTTDDMKIAFAFGVVVFALNSCIWLFAVKTSGLCVGTGQIFYILNQKSQNALFIRSILAGVFR